MILPTVHDIRPSQFGGYYVFIMVNGRECAVIVKDEDQ